MAQSSAINFGSIGVGSGAVITDWIPYTPSTQGFGSITSVNMFYRRVGDSVEIQGSFSNGTNTAVQAQVGLPSGLTADSVKVPVTQLNGQWSTASNSSIAYGNLIIASGGTVVTFGFRDASDASNTSQNASSIMPNGTTVFIYGIRIPIAGWASNTVLSTNAYFNGYIGGTTASWTSTATSFADPSNSGGNALTTVYSSGITVTAAGSNLPGITFTPANAVSVYKITATALFNVNAAGSSDAEVRMTDGTTAFAWNGYASSSASGYVPVTIVGIYAPGTASAVTVKLQLQNSNASTVKLGSGSIIFNVPSIQWQIEQIK